MARPEIRHLHGKLDHLINWQWERLAEIQQIQIKIMEDLSERNALSPHGPSRPIALPHRVGRYGGKADIALAASRRQFMGTRP
jgi:hypothetical protein